MDPWRGFKKGMESTGLRMGEAQYKSTLNAKDNHIIACERRIAELGTDLADLHSSFMGNEAIHKAELAALKGRRCQTCENGDTVAGDDSPANTYCGLHSTWWDHDAYCCYWAKRGGE